MQMLLRVSRYLAYSVLHIISDSVSEAFRTSRAPTYRSPIPATQDFSGSSSTKILYPAATPRFREASLAKLERSWLLLTSQKYQCGSVRTAGRVVHRYEGRKTVPFERPESSCVANEVSQRGFRGEARDVQLARSSRRPATALEPA